MFEKIAQEYFDKNLIVVPITIGKKAPLISNWNNIDFSKNIEKYKGFGIGIKPKASGLMVLDIDVEHEKAKEEIRQLIPPIYCGRQGSPKRLPSIFFQYDEKFEGKTYGPIEILTDNKQCVIPPTIHPQYKIPYIWVGQTDLLSADLDMIPNLSIELFTDICKIVDKYELIKKNTTTIGRNNTLIKFLGGKISDGKGPEEAIAELIEYDKENHNPPWLSDPEEGNSDPFAVAFKMYSRLYDKHVKEGGNSYNCAPEIKLDFLKPKEPTRTHLPKFRTGSLMQEMFDYLYANSNIKRSRLIYGSILGTMGTLLGNKYKFQDTYTNLYILLICYSGGGKNVPLRFPYKLFKECGLDHLIGESDIVSDNSIVMPLSKSNTRIDCIDEAEKILNLGQSNDRFASKIGTTYTEFYTCVGEHYKGKLALSYKSKTNEEGRIGECFSPCISILGATTFTDIENFMTEAKISKGFGGRFLFFQDDDFKESEMVIKESIPNSIINKIKNIEKIFKELSLLNLNGAIEVEMTKNAKEFYKKAWKESNAIRLKYHNTNMQPIANRFLENLHKLTLLDHFSVNHDNYIPIKVESLEWALKASYAILSISKELVQNHVSENEYEKYINKIKKTIYDDKKGYTFASEITNRVKGKASNRSEAYRELVDRGEIQAILIEGKKAFKPV